MIVTHFLNIFFMFLLFRSSLEVHSAFPKLYWHDDCPPGREWARFSKTMDAADSRRLWTSLGEEEAWSPAVALPSRKNLGLGRHWHFMSVQFWILTGAVYIHARKRSALTCTHRKNSVAAAGAAERCARTGAGGQ